MRILPVNLFRIRNIVQGSEAVIVPKLAAMPNDSVVLTAKSIPMFQYKKLYKFLGDFYTQKPLVSNDDLSKMKKRGFFTGPIKDVVKKLKPYYEQQFFEPTETKIFEMIAKAAENNPNMNLTELFNTWYIAARKSLRRQQKPIFDNIKLMGAELPPNKLGEFYSYMRDIDMMLYDEPIHRKFSMKEFVYKIEEKFLDKSPDGPMKTRIKKLMEELKYIHNLDGDVPEQVVKKLYDFKNLKVPGKKNLYYAKHLKPLEKDKQALELKIIHEIGEVARAYGYKKVENLCNANMNMLNGLPVTVPFSNKAFVYDLSEMLKDVPDRDLVQRIIDTAHKLPTSASSTDAFILKLKDADPNIIGNQMFDASLDSWEHVLAKSKGGPNTVENQVHARKGINSRRGNENIGDFIEKEGYDPNNPRQYIDKLVKLQKRGRMPFHDVLGQINRVEQESRIDLSAQKLKLLNQQNS